MLLLVIELSVTSLWLNDIVWLGHTLVFWRFHYHYLAHHNGYHIVLNVDIISKSHLFSSCPVPTTLAPSHDIHSCSRIIVLSIVNLLQFSPRWSDSMMLRMQSYMTKYLERVTLELSELTLRQLSMDIGGPRRR